MKDKKFEEFFEIPLRNGLTKPKKVRGNGFKMVNMGELFRFPIMNNIPMDRVPLSKNEEANSMLQSGDLLFARQSLVREGAGKCSIFLADDENVCFESHIIRCRLNKKKSNALFFYYFFCSQYGNNLIDTIVEQGAGASGIRGSDLAKIMVPDIEIDTQNKIANSLNNIDKKIALNTKTNETLEKLAQALFKSWFVDFDPVKAKAKLKEEGGDLDPIAKELGMSKEILELFPDEFEESEIGMVPKGWEVKSLDKIITPKKGKNITKKTVVSGSIPVVAGGLKPAYYHNCHNVTAPAITISASGANAGFVNLYHQNIWASDCSFVNEEETQYIYSIYLFFKSRQDEITKMQQGAAQPHVYPKDLSRIVLVDPPKEIWMKFEKSISSFFKKIKNNTNETLNLKNLRDGLLPKLLSGEVTINDLEAKR